MSLEPWDDIWRRNQHLASQLVDQGFVSRILFVAPPDRRARASFEPRAGIVSVQPPLHVPPGAGGEAVAANWLRRRWLRHVDLLWVNNAPLGRWLANTPGWYDVTDDWRTLPQSERSRRRVIRAEDVLARRLPTVVCSAELARRWRERYGVDPPVVRNGVDTEALTRAAPEPLLGAPPHVGYVGTLHRERVDVELTCAVAASPSVGTVHLIGPSHLDEDSASRLRETPKVLLHGPVPASRVPGFLKAMDVLVVPHVVTPFTLSLDAIKAAEFLATDKQVVSTPTSGFQDLCEEGLQVVNADGFVAAVEAAVGRRQVAGPRGAVDWAIRGREFAQAAGLVGAS